MSTEMHGLVAFEAYLRDEVDLVGRIFRSWRIKSLKPGYDNNFRKAAKEPPSGKGGGPCLPACLLSTGVRNIHRDNSQAYRIHLTIYTTPLHQSYPTSGTFTSKYSANVKIVRQNIKYPTPRSTISIITFSCNDLRNGRIGYM